MATQRNDIEATVRALHLSFASGRTKAYDWRVAQLDRLFALFDENEERLMRALNEDLGKPGVEAWVGEVGFLKSGVRYARRRLRRWMKPTRVGTPLLNFRGKSRVYREPFGVALIIGPWNYPLQLVFEPLIGALAAGNCVLVKPSEIAPSCAALVAELVPRYLDEDCVRVIEGGVAETTEILAQRFDYIFFTGSTVVGKIVYAAAADNLTPVTLELGGKSPCIVDGDVDLELAARRMTWGKFFNAGQTCVAPDYVLVSRSRERELVDQVAKTIGDFYGSDPSVSPDFARIVSERHHDRLVGLLGGGKVVTGGQHDRASRYLAPTVLTDVAVDAPVMQEEIFGPVLPILPVDGIDEAIEFVNARPKPLALYVFSKDRHTSDTVLARTSSGGASVNDTLTHLVPHELPFGGVGDSGIGAYHGRHSYTTFSHQKSVFDRKSWPDLSLRYPPYGGALRWLKRLLG